MNIGGVALLVGFLGMVAYGTFRFFEIKKGKRFFEDLRSWLDVGATRLYRFFVFGEISIAYRTWILQAFRALTHKGVVLLVATLRAIERPLSRLNHRLRRAQSQQGEMKRPSSFLESMREVKSKDGEKPPSPL